MPSSDETGPSITASHSGDITDRISKSASSGMDAKQGLTGKYCTVWQDLCADSTFNHKTATAEEINKRLSSTYLLATIKDQTAVFHKKCLDTFEKMAEDAATLSNMLPMYTEEETEGSSDIASAKKEANELTQSMLLYNKNKLYEEQMLKLRTLETMMGSLDSFYNQEVIDAQNQAEAEKEALSAGGSNCA